MKVVFVEQFGELGGAQRCLLDLLPAAREAGWTGLVLAPASGEAPSPLELAVERLGFRAARYEARRYSAGRKSGFEHLLFLPDLRRLERELRRRFEAEKPDLVYVNGTRPAPAAARAARGLAPVLFHCHNHVAQRTAAWLLRRTLAQTGAHVVACCRFAAEPIAAALSGRLRVVMNGVIGPSEPVPRPGGSTAGVIGRIAPEKGQLELLDAVPLVAARLPEARFRIAGEALFGDPRAEDYRDAVAARARELPVELLGWREDVGEVLARLDLLVVPSIREPATTRVILEAYAHGVPVVAFDSGGISEVLRDGETGRLVRPLEPRALAAAIVEAFSGRERLGRWSRAARQRWERELTIERYRREMLAAMEAVL